MSIRSFIRTAVLVLPGFVVAGCSSTVASLFGDNDQAAYTRSGECAVNRSRCIYEGSYDAGERDYAEEQARRLNQAQLERLKRMSL